MTIAGQDDERPGEDRPSDDQLDDERPGKAPDGIHYFDFSDPFDPSEEEADPFASENPADRSATDAPPPPHPTRESHDPTFQDVFEFALTGLPSAPPPADDAPSEPSEHDGPAEPPSASFSSLASLLETEGRLTKRRQQFAEVFDDARADTDRPFLAVALRLEGGDEAADRFPDVERGIREALDPGDVLLAAPNQSRLVVVLPGRGAEAARPLFARLMSHLREHVPDAEKVGRDIAVLAAPDGHPFQRAADFLAATFDAS